MNDYVSRSEVSPVDRASVRAAAPVQAVQPVSASAGTAMPDRDPSPSRAIAPSFDTADIDGDVASAAEYVKIHAEISSILADLNTNGGSTSVSGAADAIQSLIPTPIILVPLPPASKDAVEHAAVIAKRMVEQAVFAQAAQAPLRRGTVEQVMSTSL
ncbi:hypothetical protein [Sphingobium sp.]|uniref:hypothetical protein n=1 Tax=Sphingobium sp. TaxID=1912891 RepID=UPI003BB6AF5A